MNILLTEVGIEKIEKLWEDRESGYTQKERNVSLDALRGIVMLWIVLSHVMLHGKVVENIEPFTVNYYLSLVQYMHLYMYM